MFTKLLVTTDLSERSLLTFSACEKLKKLGAKEAYLIHCFKNPFNEDVMATEQILGSFQPTFDAEMKELKKTGLEVTGKVIMSGSYYDVNNQAIEQDSSVVIVGSGAPSESGKARLGGVASRMIHSAEKPVLIVRAKLTKEGDTLSEVECDFDPLGHILFATDFSDNAQHAFSYVLNLAECGAKRITLIHVRDKDHMEEQQQKLGKLKAQIESKGSASVDIEEPIGSPKNEIISYTRNQDISMVVMGTLGKGYIKEMFFGSVSQAVARYAESSVLLVPPED